MAKTAMLGLLVAVTLMHVPDRGTVQDRARCTAVLPELRALLDGGRYAEARARADAYLAELQVAGERESLRFAQVVDLLLQAERELERRLDDRKQLAQRAVTIKELRLPHDSLELASSLENLAAAERDAGALDRATELCRRVLEIRQRRLGRDHLDVAASLHQLAWLEDRAGEFETAREHYQRAIEIRERQLGPNDLQVAKSLNNLAILLRRRGEFEAARRLYERALAIKEHHHGKDDPALASSLNNLAIVLRSLGDFTMAKDVLTRSVGLYEASQSVDPTRLAQTLSSLSNLQRDMGEVVAARQSAERALGILERELGSEHPRLAPILNNLGILAHEAGEFPRARGLLERALGLREAAFGTHHPELASTLSNLGLVYERLGRPDRARASLDRALAIRETVLGADHPSVAHTLRAVAWFERRTGAPTRSRLLFERALAIQRARLGDRHPEVALVLRDLAVALMESGEAQRAFDLALAADRSGRAHLQLTASVLPQRQALRYSMARPAAQAVALTLLDDGRVGGAAAVAQAWDAVLGSRGLVLTEMQARRRNLEDHAELAAQLAETSERLANLLVNDPGDDTDAYRRQIDRLRSARDDAEAALARRSLQFRLQQQATRAGFDGVRRALPSTSALIAYVRYIYQGEARGEPRYAAFVLSGGSDVPRFVPLGPADTIDGLVADWRVAIDAGVRALPMTGGLAERRYREAGEALRRAVWDPLGRGIASGTRVFLVLDGALQIVNFATLPDGDSRYLVDDETPLHYLGAERDLVELEHSGNPGRGILLVAVSQAADRAVGDTFGSDEACVQLDAPMQSRLAGSSREVADILDLWEARSTVDRGAAVVVRGEEATEGRVKRLAAGQRVIHLATHGFVAPDRCAASETNAAGSALAAELTASERSETPVLSGLLLAREPSGTGAGLLTDVEVMAMDLSGVEWVVLSGCETGLGEIRSGEGILGLRRAFQVAGAQTVIMSLWAADDNVSRLWMTNLYSARFDGAGSAEAAWQATRALLDERRAEGLSSHPYYWGPFVSIGDWR